MSSIRILVCDDDSDWKTVVEDQLEEYGDAVAVDFFQDPTDAVKAAAETYYHAAFIDIYYPAGVGRAQDPRGIDLSAALDNTSPSCKQVLMTRFAAPGFSTIFEHVWSVQGAVPAVINKSAQRLEYVNDFVRKNFSKRFERDWKMPDVTGIAETLTDAISRRKKIKVRSSDQVKLELESLLFDLFDEAASISLAETAPSLRIENHHFGQSGSIVLETRIHYGHDESDKPVLGTRCVVKIGSLASTKKEERSIANSFAWVCQLSFASNCFKPLMGIPSVPSATHLPAARAPRSSPSTRC